MVRLRLPRGFKYMSHFSSSIGLADAALVLLLMSLMKPCYIKHRSVKFRRVSRKIFIVRGRIDKYKFCGNCLITFRNGTLLCRIPKRHYYQEEKQEFL